MLLCCIVTAWKLSFSVLVTKRNIGDHKFSFQKAPVANEFQNEEDDIIEEAGKRKRRAIDDGSSTSQATTFKTHEEVSMF